jgi:hypothetical protein
VVSKPKKGFAEAPDTGNLEKNEEGKQMKTSLDICYRFRSFPVPEPFQPLRLMFLLPKKEGGKIVVFGLFSFS